MVLLLTPGDPAGIGPEITLRALKKSPKSARLICIGAPEPFIALGARLKVLEPSASLRKLPKKTASEIYFIPAPQSAQLPASDRLAQEGYQAGWSIQCAVGLIRAGLADALVTGPINKSKLRRGGFPFPGHTEMLAALCAPRKAKPLPVTMMLANSSLRVSLVTTHIAHSSVSRSLRPEGIERAILQTADFLRFSAGIKKPKVAVCALNPHAGEGGLFGTEEQEVILPAIRSLQRKLQGDVELLGPLPSDTLFAQHYNSPRLKRFDAVVCMYHDQGLIPVKLVDFYETVNISLGLPILRTSVDHGVAYDLVGKGTARPDSMISAIQLALKLARTRKKFLYTKEHSA